MERFLTAAPWVVLAFAAAAFPVLFFVVAPYGRHLRQGFGPTMPARWGWTVMEAPSFFLFGALWLRNPAWSSPSVLLLGALWLLHYGQRTFVFPALMRGADKRKPLLTVLLAVLFNVLNASGNAAALADQPFSPRLLAGVLLFTLGLALNLHADHVLRTLRGPFESGYKIPRGGLYRWVSAPNYLAEILEWSGFALAAWTLPALAFAVFTFANLAPRAWAHHRWYQRTFPDYPRERRALVPHVW